MRTSPSLPPELLLSPLQLSSLSGYLILPSSSMGLEYSCQSVNCSSSSSRDGEGTRHLDRERGVPLTGEGDGGELVIIRRPLPRRGFRGGVDDITSEPLLDE